MDSPAQILRPYQVPHAKQLLQALIGYRAALDASDTGTGKTPVAMVVAKLLGMAPRIICPRSLIPTWQAWSDRVEVPAEVVNYEKARVSGSKWGELVPHGRGSYWRWYDPCSLIIFDEVQNCGGQSTIQSKMLKAAKRQCGYVLGLSATAAESPLQLEALGFALGLHDGKNFWNWLLKYGCKPGVFGGMVWTDDPQEQAKAMDRLNKLIYPKRGARMRKSLIPSFPKTQVEPKLLPQTEKTQALVTALYDLYGDKFETVAEELEAYGIAPDDAEAREEVIANRSARRLGLMQKVRMALELEMVPDVVELVQLYAETSKVVVFANYTQTLDELQHQIWDAFGRGWQPGIVDGRQMGEKGLEARKQMVARFQANLEPAILINAQAGGAGLSLHDEATQVDRTTLVLPMYSGRQLEQVLGRANRDGGGFSLQLLLGIAGTPHEDILLTVQQRRSNLITLNDGIFYGHGLAA